MRQAEATPSNPGPNAQVLLVEDDPAIARTIVFALTREGMQVTHCLLLADAQSQVSRYAFGVAVLDIGLPDGSGLDWCKRLRTSGNPLPILMLSARSDELDRVLGLELGADDYLAKPFSPRELVARVRAMLRRAAFAKPGVTAAPTGLVLDAPGHSAQYFGRALPLTRIEFLLLDKLFAAKGRVLTREALLSAVWDADAGGNQRTVDTHIKTLRAKLKDADAGFDPISTLRGVGYGYRE